MQMTAGNVRSIFDGDTFDEYKSNTFSFLPSVGYFIVDDLAIGFAGNTTVSTTRSSGDKVRSQANLLMPTLVYFLPVGQQVRPVLQAGGGLASQSVKYIWSDGDNSKTKYTGGAINIGGGIACFLNEHISLNTGLAHTWVMMADTQDSREQIRQGNFTWNVGLSLYLKSAE